MKFIYYVVFYCAMYNNIHTDQILVQLYQYFHEVR